MMFFVMKPHTLLCLFVAVVAMAFGSCNDDVFVSGDLPAANLEVRIEGDGGETTVGIAKKGLEKISVDRYDGMKQFRCYNHAGEEIPCDSPAAEIARIVYESVWLNYEIVVEKDALRIKSIENCSGIEMVESIRLEYAYATRFIKVSIEAGERMRLETCAYEGDMEIVDNAGTRAERKSFNNGGHIDQTFGVYPMIQAQSYAYAIVKPADSWAKTFKLAMPLLQYHGGWVIEASKDEFYPGDKYRFSIPNLLDKVTVPVPANTKVVVTSEVTMTTARASGVMTFLAPVSGKKHDVPFTCEAIYPKCYDVKIEDEKN